MKGIIMKSVREFKKIPTWASILHMSIWFCPWLRFIDATNELTNIKCSGLTSIE